MSGAVTQILALLTALEHAIPLPTGRHGLTRCKADDGSPDRLGLHIRLAPQLNQTFFLDDADFERPIAEVVAIIVAECERAKLDQGA